MNGSKTRVLSVALALLPTLLLVAVSSRAATWYIKPDGTGDLPTIADALAAADAGDEIILAPGTFHEYDLRIASKVDIRGEVEDPALTVVDAGGLGRCFDASGLGGASGALQMTGITLANGSHDTRGGLLEAEASTRATCTISCGSSTASSRIVPQTWAALSTARARSVSDSACCAATLPGKAEPCMPTSATRAAASGVRHSRRTRRRRRGTPFIARANS